MGRRKNGLSVVKRKKRVELQPVICISLIDSMQFIPDIKQETITEIDHKFNAPVYKDIILETDINNEKEVQLKRTKVENSPHVDDEDSETDSTVVNSTESFGTFIKTKNNV